MRRAIELAPCSVRALAKQAGVPHVTLVWIRQGKRKATAAVAGKVGAALRKWGNKCFRAADVIAREQDRIRRSKGGKQ